MYFRRFKRMSCGEIIFFTPVSHQHYTPEGAMTEAVDEAYRRFPFNHTARQLFLSNTYCVKEEYGYGMEPPIAIQSREASFAATLDELCGRS